MNEIRRVLFWLVWNVPLGKLAPHILGFALGSKPQQRVTEEEARF
jgi:hypothetical protein